LDADKGDDIVTIDLSRQSAIADYMIVASGTSSRHVSAMAGRLKDRLNVRGVKDVKIEGMGQSDWVAIDAGDIIIHLFRPEVREFYNIEKMWGAPLVAVPSDTNGHATA
jgi:ribosome-associated protein